MFGVFAERHKILFPFFILIVLLLGLLLLGIVFLGSLNSVRNVSILASKTISGGVPAASPGYFGGSGLDVAYDNSYAENTAGEEAVSDRSVIKTGSLSLLVERAEDSAEAIRRVAESAGGFVENLGLYEVSEGVKNGSVSIRVPSERFSETLEKIKGLAVKVEREEVNARDVTDQLLDMDARLRNLEATEKQFLAIMEQAYRVEDILNVQKELSTVREQIERLKAQKENIEKQVDMSTIYVSLVSEPDAEVFGIIWRPFYILKQAVRDALTDLKNFVDGLLYLIIRLPVFLLRLAVYLIGLFIAFLIGRKLFRWGKNRFFRDNKIN